MAEYQVQLQYVTADGNKIPTMPISRSLDVKVGKLSTGSLVLPGSSDDEILAQTLANVKKYLSNLANVAAKSYGVTSLTTDASESNLATAKAVNDLKVRIDGNDETLATHKTDIDGKAPIDHAASTLIYGGGTHQKYGHVMLSDIFAYGVENGDASYSIGASQNALFHVYNTLNGAKAEIYHASSSRSYGLGSASQYGHVKLSDTYTSSVSNGGASGGIGASQNALYNAYAALKDLIDVNIMNISEKSPTNHASADTTYGVGTGNKYGHVKLSDDYDKDNSLTGAAVNSIAASSWALYRAFSSLSTVIAEKAPKSHVTEQATGDKFSHVKLSDKYAESVGAASTGIGASQNALYNAYAALLSSITSLESGVTTLNSNMFKRLIVDRINTTGGISTFYPLFATAIGDGENQPIYGDQNISLLKNSAYTCLQVGYTETSNTGIRGAILLGHDIDKYATTLVPKSTTHSGQITLSLPATSGNIPIATFDDETATLTITI